MLTDEQRIRNLRAPYGAVDLVLDTDAYNEIDDQFAIAYMLAYRERLNVRGFMPRLLKIGVRKRRPSGWRKAMPRFKNC